MIRLFRMCRKLMHGVAPIPNIEHLGVAASMDGLYVVSSEDVLQGSKRSRRSHSGWDFVPDVAL